MKKALFSILFLSIAIAGYSQRFIGSVIAGANVSQVDGDEVAGFYKIGANAGMSVMLPLDEKFRWFGTIELLYSQKGSKQTAYRANAILKEDDRLLYRNEDFSVPFNKKMKYQLELDYVQVPVVFHYEDWRSGCALGVGFSWNRLVRVKELENGWTTTTNLRSGTYRRNDWTVIADAKIRLYKGLKLNLRYEYSLVPSRRRVFNPFNDLEEVRKSYHSVISLRLIYSFNEKYVKNTEYVKGGGKGPRWLHDTSTGWYQQ